MIVESRPILGLGAARLLTVIFATHNGERTLPTVLDAYRSLKPPVGGFKLVAIDNASRDRTAEILREFESTLPLTRLSVAAPGKNRALNAGLEHREGDLIVLTDDDAVPAPDWLEQLRAAADRYPEFDIFGGAIRPRWERPPEPWHLHWVPHGITYAITNPALADEPMPAAIAAWGPNMAVRARVFDAGHRFDEHIGPKSGGSYAMGSETEFTKRLEQAGYRARFVGGAAVEHMIRSFQMERHWVLARAERYGRSLCYRERLLGQPPPAMLFGVPRFRVRRLAEHCLRLVAATLLGRRQAAFDQSWGLRLEWGYMQECRKARDPV